MFCLSNLITKPPELAFCVSSLELHLFIQSFFISRYEAYTHGVGGTGLVLHYGYLCRHNGR